MKYLLLALVFAGCVTQAKFQSEQTCIVNSASGFKMDKYVVTADHVCRSDSVLIVDSDDRIYHGRVVARDRQNDICIVEYPNPDFWDYSVADVHPRQTVYSNGNPLGLYFSELEGEVQNVHREDRYGKVVIQIGIDVFFGSSGSPVYDGNGALVGVIVEGIPGTRFTFIVPIQKVVLLILKTKRNEN